MSRHLCLPDGAARISLMTTHAGTMAYAKGFVDRLDQVSVEGQPLSSLRVVGNYDFTPFYRHWDLYRVKNAHERTSRGAEEGSTGKAPHILTAPAILFLSLLSLGYHLVRRPKIVLYAIDKLSSLDRDHDARLEGVYRYVRKQNVPFVEVMHTLPAESFWPNLIARRRVPIYFESVDALFGLLRRLDKNLVTFPDDDAIDLSLFSEEEHALARALVRERLLAHKRSTFRVRMFKKLLLILRPTALFTIDDPKYYGELLTAADLLGIPAYAFQHGHFTDYHPGFLSPPQGHGEVPMPTRFFVWSDYWKQELQALGTYLPGERVVVGGILRPLTDSLATPQGDRLHVLVPYETVAPKQEVQEALAALRADARVRIYFKIRKDTPARRQLEEYALTPSDTVVVIDDVRHAVGEVDVVLGTYSTFLYDMIAYGFPIALLHTSSDYGAGMVRTGLASLVGKDGYEKLVSELATCSSMPQVKRQELRDRLYGTPPIMLSNTLDQLGKELSL